MTKSSKSQKRANRELRKIQDAGIAGFVIGVFFLLAPLFAGNNKILKPLAENLSSKLSWMFILIGIGLIGLYALLKQIKPKDKNTDDTKVVNVKAKPKRIGLLALTPEQTSTISTERSVSWNKQVFADIEWRRFEAVCESLFAQSGFKTKSQSHGADGGVDVWMYSAHAEGPVSIAQCKHFRSKEVDVKLIREFFGVMASHKLQRGTFVTTSTFTADAQKFANENGINTLDGDKLLKLIATRTPEQQKELLDIAYEGEYSIPTCASCGIKLVERVTKADQKKFWGCSNFPKCRTQIYFKAA
jgi:restriction system protein